MEQSSSKQGTSAVQELGSAALVHKMAGEMAACGAESWDLAISWANVTCAGCLARKPYCGHQNLAYSAGSQWCEDCGQALDQGDTARGEDAHAVEEVAQVTIRETVHYGQHFEERTLTTGLSIPDVQRMLANRSDWITPDVTKALAVRRSLRETGAAEQGWVRWEVVG